MSNHANRILERPVAEIVIKLLRSGQVRVTGPLAKDKLCQEMLREASNVVRTFQAEIAKQIITPEQRAVIEV